MTKKTKLKWRLSKLPTVGELQQLVLDKIITKDEEKDILFTSEEVNERDNKSLEEEIKFLRRLVEELSKNNRKNIIKHIEVVKTPYFNYDWYKPYYYYFEGITNPTLTVSGGSVNGLTGSNQTSPTLTANTAALMAAPTAANFSDIKTF